MKHETVGVTTNDAVRYPHLHHIPIRLPPLPPASHPEMRLIGRPASGLLPTPMFLMGGVTWFLPFMMSMSPQGQRWWGSATGRASSSFLSLL